MGRGFVALGLFAAVLAHAGGSAADEPPGSVQDPSQPSPQAVAEASPEAVLDVGSAIREAVRNNPGLAEMEARSRAMAAVPPQAGTLPDPSISLRAMNLPVDSFNLSQEGMTQIQFGLSQAIPFPGKLDLREMAAQREAEAAASDVEEARLRLVRNVKKSWWNLYYLDRALDTVSRNQELLRQFVEIAQTKYEVGQGLQQDVLLAQVELSKLLELEIRLEGMRRNEEARLNALLDRATDGSIRLPQEVDTALPEVASERDLIGVAEQWRPLLRSGHKRVNAAEVREDLAQKDYYPDFKLGAAYGVRSGSNPMNVSRPDFFTVGVTMSVPLYTATKQDRAVEQRLAERARRQSALDDDRAGVRAEVSRALADLKRAREQMELMKTGIIPQAAQTVDSMRAGYLVNKVDFLNLVSAQITLYDYETQYWKAVSEAKKALADLAAATGKEMDDE